MVRFGELRDGREVVFADQLGERFAPVVADGVSFRRSAGKELGQMRDEVVAAALEEFLGQIRCPVGAFDFQRVGENGIRRLRLPNADSSGSATSRKCSSMAAREKWSRTLPSAPKAARLTCMPVWLAMKKSAVRPVVPAGAARRGEVDALRGGRIEVLSVRR